MPRGTINERPNAAERAANEPRRIGFPALIWYKATVPMTSAGSRTASAGAFSGSTLSWSMEPSWIVACAAMSSRATTMLTVAGVAGTGFALRRLK